MRIELTIINRKMALRFLSLLFSTSPLNRVTHSFKMLSKMKILFFISLFCVSSTAWSQPWQDALKKARESYLVKSYDKAVTEYQTAQKLAPKEIDLSVELAQSLYKAEKYEEAEKTTFHKGFTGSMP